MNRANDNETNPMGSDTVNQPTGFTGSKPNTRPENINDMASQPLAGEPNGDIPGFGQANQISKTTGEPIPNQTHITGEAGLVRTAEKEDIDTRFSSVDTIPQHNAPVGSTTVGGNYYSDPIEAIEAARKREKEAARAETVGDVQIDTTGMPNVDKGNEKDPTTTREESKNLYYSQYPNEALKKDIPEENNDHGGDLRNQMAGGPNPDSESLRPSQAKHEVTEKEMYYAESTGKVNPSEKLGQQATGNGQTALESGAGGVGPADKSITTEKESDYVPGARQEK